MIVIKSRALASILRRLSIVIDHTILTRRKWNIGSTSMSHNCDESE